MSLWGLLLCTWTAAAFDVVEPYADFSHFPWQPSYLGIANLGPNMVSGYVDVAGDDAVSFDVPAGMHISDVLTNVYGFNSTGSDGFIRMYTYGPQVGLGDVVIPSNGAYNYVGMPLAGDRTLGLFLASYSPWFAYYYYETFITVEYDFMAYHVGSCPGSSTISVAHGTPGGPIAFASGRAGARTLIPYGACAGTVIPLGRPVLRGVETADNLGAVDLPATLFARSCGQSWVAVDLTTCTVSTVDVL